MTLTLLTILSMSVLVAAADKALADPEPIYEAYVDDDYTETADNQFTSIGDALDALADDGPATVYIHAGTYEENLRIDRADTALVGLEDGVIIDGSAGVGSPDTISLTEGRVNLTRLTIQGAIGGLISGLRINTFDNRIENCTIKDNEYGITIYRGSGNTIINCTIEDNAMDGIYAWTNTHRLYGAQLINSTVRRNAGAGLRLFGDSVDEYVKGTLVEGTTLTENGAGIWTENAVETTVTRSKITWNGHKGIYIGPNDNPYILTCEDKIYENLIGGNGLENSDGTGYGLEIAEDKGRNRIYKNNFVDNAEGPRAYDGDSSTGDEDDNRWDSTPLDGPLSSWTLGNHWSNFEDRYPAAEDADENGIYDSPYNKYGLASRSGVTIYSLYPLVYPFESYTQEPELTETGTVSFDIYGDTGTGTGPLIENNYDIPPYEESTMEFLLDYTTDWEENPQPPAPAVPDGHDATGISVYSGSKSGGIANLNDGDDDTSVHFSSGWEAAPRDMYGIDTNKNYEIECPLSWIAPGYYVRILQSCWDYGGDIETSYLYAVDNDYFLCEADSSPNSDTSDRADAYPGAVHITHEVARKGGSSVERSWVSGWVHDVAPNNLPGTMTRLETDFRWRFKIDTEGRYTGLFAAITKVQIKDQVNGDWENMEIEGDGWYAWSGGKNTGFIDGNWATNNPAKYLSNGDIEVRFYMKSSNKWWDPIYKEWNYGEIDSGKVLINKMNIDYIHTKLKYRQVMYGRIDIDDIDDDAASADSQIFWKSSGSGTVYDENWNPLFTMNAGYVSTNFDALGITDLEYFNIVGVGSYNGFSGTVYDVTVFDSEDYDTARGVHDRSYFDFYMTRPPDPEDPPIPELQSIAVKGFRYWVDTGGSGTVYEEDIVLTQAEHDGDHQSGSYLYYFDTTELTHRDITQRAVVLSQEPELEFSISDNPGYHIDLKIRYNEYFWQAFPETIELETPAGTSVTVRDESGFTLTFDEVTAEGTTAVQTELLPEDDPGFEVAGRYYDVSTTATYQGNVEVGMPYDENAIPVPEEELRIYHYDDDTGEWVDATSWVDITNDIVYATVTHFSGFVLGYERDETAPEVSIEYKNANATLSGDATDGYPGVWVVEAEDAESGINADLTEIYIDGELAGTELGTYPVPNGLGLHRIDAHVSNNNPEGPLETVETVFLRVLDDDTTEPAVFIEHVGDGTDGDPGRFEWDISDLDDGIGGDGDSGLSEITVEAGFGRSHATFEWEVISDAPAGSWELGNALGDYGIRITATDNDDDRTLEIDSLTTEVAETVGIVDDDTTEPSIEAVTVLGKPVYDAEDLVLIDTKASDESGISEIHLTFDGTIYSDKDGDGRIALPNPRVPGRYDFEVTVYDGDMDRPGDRLSTSKASFFEVVDDDTERPTIDWDYTGDGTDGNPGTLEVSAADESGLALDPSGSYPVPNSLGTHTFIFEATDADQDWEGDSLTTVVSVTVEIRDDDTTAPLIEITYSGGGTDGDPGHFEWEITDTDDGIGGDGDTGFAEISVKVRYESSEGLPNEIYELGGTQSGTFALPPYLGTYTLTVYARDADDDRGIEDSLSTTLSKGEGIEDDDTIPPTITSVDISNGPIYDDYDEVEVSIEAFDASGIHQTWITFDGTIYLDGDGDGTIALPNPVTPGNYTFKVTAVDDDYDRPGDRLSATEDFSFEVLDDDTEPPDITNVRAGADWRTVNVSFDATDESGIHEILFFVEGEPVTDYELFVDGDSHLFVTKNRWIKRDGNYTVEVRITDDDDDRPGDRLTASVFTEFEVSLRDMYDYVIHEVAELEAYALNASEDMHWIVGKLFRRLVARPLNLTQRELETAYELIAAGNATEGLVHDIYAQILVRFTDMRAEMFERFDLIDEEVAGHLDVELKQIRDDIVLLMGASTREVEGYEMALVEVDLFRLMDHIREDLAPSVGAHGWRSLGRVASLHSQVKVAALDLEVAIVTLTCEVNASYTESLLNESQRHLRHAMDRVGWLLDEGDIDRETHDGLIDRLEGSIADIEAIKSNLQ